MSRSGLVSWILLVVWSAWLHAVQGLLARGPAAGFLPELGLVLIACLAAELDAKDVPKAALWIGFARAAVSVDPPVVILAGYLGVGLAALALRSIFDLRSAFYRSVFAGLTTFLFSGWISLAARARAAPFAPTDIAGIEPWHAALASAVAALLLAPLLARLPGLRPLTRRNKWHAAGSYR